MIQRHYRLERVNQSCTGRRGMLLRPGLDRESQRGGQQPGDS